ncbi:hypothetical protein XENTR_v10006067 [Xenopus tropicalis]|nr:hypothetical protein XENTR_v10006067 [Xenopus tropicalis]
MEKYGEVRESWRKSVLSWLPHVQLTTGVVLTVLTSLIVSAPALIKVDNKDDVGPLFDLEPGSLGITTGYKLFIYIYFHEDFSSLVCSTLIIWFFGGGFEENVGTAKFWLLTPFFAVSSGLLYLAILATGLSFQANVTVQGFTSVAFTMLSVFTIRSHFKRMLFFGFMVPTKMLPLFFLILALFLPHAPVLSNVCGILVGIAYGMSGFFCLDLPESIMSRIDQIFLCRLLKRIPIWTYVPGSSAERNAAQSRK